MKSKNASDMNMEKEAAAPLELRELHKKRKGLKVWGFLALVFLMVYIPSFLHWVYGTNVTTDILKIGTIEDSVNTDGVVIRNEEVLKSPFDGKCIMEAAEGDRIPVRFRVAQVLNQASEKANDDIRSVDLKIIKSQKEKIESKDFFSEDVAKIEDDLAQKARQLAFTLNEEDMSGLKSVKGEIDELLKKRALILGSLGGSDAYVESLKKEKQRLEEQLKQNTREIFSDSPGIISYAIDGYETVLTPEGIKDLKPSSLAKLKFEKTADSPNPVRVSAGKPFAKIIKDIETHIVFPMDSKRAQRLKKDDDIKLRLNDLGKTFNANVEYISAEEGGKCLVAVSTDRGASEMTAMRKLNVDVILDSYKGYKVPLKSLTKVDMDGKQAVLVIVSANYANFKKVKITGSDGEFAIIDNPVAQKSDNIGLYSIYVVDPQNIQEGQMVSK